VNGTLSGTGMVSVTGAAELGASGKITTDKLLVSGSLAVSNKGLAMNAKTSAIEINGGMLASKGKISAASLKLNGGSLSLSGALSVKDLTLGSGTLTLNSAKLATVKVGNILTLDDALQSWAAEHPEQQKLAEALRLHYLLYVHNASWRTSPENNAITLEVRKRLRLIIQEIPSDVMDADRKQYVLKTFDVQDAMEARNLRRWKAAHQQ
jgi:hypothetical protein